MKRKDQVYVDLKERVKECHPSTSITLYAEEVEILLSKVDFLEQTIVAIRETVNRLEGK